MHYELADYEAAFDGQPPRRGLEASWALLRRLMRRHRRLRQLQLAAQAAASAAAEQGRLSQARSVATR